MDTKILEEIGFTQKEIDVYMVMLTLKTSSIFEIMSKAKVSRQTIYEILQKLLDKGLVSYTIENNKKQYNVTNPKRLLSIISEQEIIFKEKGARLQALLPDILKRYNENKQETRFEMFIGKEGMKTVMNNTLEPGKQLYILANEDKVLDFLEYFMLQFRKKRKELNIPIKIIRSECTRKKKLVSVLAEIKHLPDEYNTPTTTIICEDNVDILIFSEENPIAIHMKSKEIAHSFMNYFNLMWSIAKK